MKKKLKKFRYNFLEKRIYDDGEVLLSKFTRQRTLRTHTEAKRIGRVIRKYLPYRYFNWSDPRLYQKRGKYTRTFKLLSIEEIKIKRIR